MTKRSRAGRRTWVLVAAALAVATASVLVGAAAPAGAETNGSWSIFPTTVSGQLVRPYFQPVLTAGQSYADSVTVTNQTQTAATFNLYAADAYNTPTGGFALKRRTDHQTAMGAWIQLPITQITLEPRSYEVIPFTIDVPAGTAPGDHAGGIVIESTTGTTTVHGSLAITALRAVGVRVYGRVQGKLSPSLAVTGLSVAAHTSVASLFGLGAPSTVTFTVANTGNVRLTSKAVVTLAPLFGGSAGTRTVTVPELLPQNAVTYKVPFGSTLTYGQLTANVSIIATGSSSSGSASTLVIPWLLLLVLVVIVVLLVAWRRRKHRLERAGSGPVS